MLKVSFQPIKGEDSRTMEEDEVILTFKSGCNHRFAEPLIRVYDLYLLFYYIFLMLIVYGCLYFEFVNHFAQSLMFS